MENVEMAVKGNKLTIVVDIDKDFGPSSTGKTICVATTKGFQRIGNGNGKEVMVSLNVNKKPQ